MSPTPPHLPPGGSGKPLSPQERDAANRRALLQIEGAVFELGQLLRGLEARVKQLRQSAHQLRQEIEKSRKGSGIIVTNQMPPAPETLS